MTASVKKEHEYGWPEQQEWILKILNQKFQEQEIAIQNMLNIALDWEELSRGVSPRQTFTNEPIVSSTQLLLGKSLEAVADEPIDGDQSEAKMTTTSTRKGIASLGKAVEREVSQPAPPIRKLLRAIRCMDGPYCLYPCCKKIKTQTQDKHVFQKLSYSFMSSVCLEVKRQDLFSAARCRLQPW